MTSKIFHLFLFLCILSISACGGGSSGTAIGGSGDSTRFAGLVLAPDGSGVASAYVTLKDTEEVALTDEAGAFDLNSRFVTGTATFEIQSPAGENAQVTVQDTQQNPSRLDLSILFNAQSETAQLLELTMRARMVRSCSTFFLNTRTIRQTAPIIEGLECVLEVEFKRNGLPVDDLVFELQHRSCDADSDWEFSAVAKTGTSGPGTGEVEFPFRNDERHCVYRVIGPNGVAGTIPISTQINTLRKERYDDQHQQ